MATEKYKIESGAQLLARLSKKTEIENFYPFLFGCGLKHDDIVEINSNSNTSYLLIDIICEALYPNKDNGKLIGGILMFNTAGNFSYEQLIKTLERKVQINLLNNGTETSKAEIDITLHRILSNFYLLEIYDATQFYTTIHNMDSIFMKHSNISFLIFDTLTAFYWSEQGFKITKMDLYIKNLLRIIQNVSKEYKVVLIYTKPGYFSSSKDTDNLKAIEVTDSITFKVQLLDNSSGAYSVNVKTLDSNFKRSFNIIDNLIKWQ